MDFMEKLSDEYRNEDILEYFELQPGEEIIKILKRTLKSYFIPKIIHYCYFGIFILIYYLVLIKWLNSYLSENFIISNVFNPIFIVFYIFIILFLIIAIIQMIIGYWFVRGHTYIITTDRIIMIRKFISISYREIDFKRITDLILYQSLWGRIFNFGILMPVTAGVEMGMAKMGNFSIEGVIDVFKVRHLIMNLIKKFQDKLRQKYLISNSSKSDIK